MDSFSWGKYLALSKLATCQIKNCSTRTDHLAVLLLTTWMFSNCLTVAVCFFVSFHYYVGLVGLPMALPGIQCMRKILAVEIELAL